MARGVADSCVMSQPKVICCVWYQGKWSCTILCAQIQAAGLTAVIVVWCLIETHKIGRPFSWEAFLVEQTKQNKKDIVLIYIELYISIPRGGECCSFAGGEVIAGSAPLVCELAEMDAVCSG